MNQKRKVVVAVSGGFDPVHAGHIRHFQEAKKLGDYLVVFLNTDEWLTEKKGKPFMGFDERKEILESIRYVDEVVRVIDKDDSVALTLELVNPDIFGKGGNRVKKTLPKSEIEACQRLGIRLVFGVGGGKIQSSSWLLPKNAKRR